MKKLFKKKKFKNFIIEGIDDNWIEKKIKELLQEDFEIYFEFNYEFDKIIITNYKEITEDFERIEKVKYLIESELIARMHDFDFLINEYFYNKIKFEKQGKLFLEDLISIIKSFIGFIEESDSFYKNKNIIQAFLLDNYLKIYNDTILNFKKRFSDLLNNDKTSIGNKFLGEKYNNYRDKLWNLHLETNNQIKKNTEKDIKDNIWFKVGCKFADGEIYKLHNEGLNFTKIAIELFENKGYSNYISTSYSDSVKSDKNIFCNLEKMKKIYDYFKDGNFPICDEFEKKYQSLISKKNNT